MSVMGEDAEAEIDNIVELYKQRICAALDSMSIDDIRKLVAEIEARMPPTNPSPPMS